MKIASLFTWIREAIQILLVFFGVEDEDEALSTCTLERETIPAPGWSAIFTIQDNHTEYPLVAWDVTYKDDQPFEMVGLVFCGNKPPFVEKASSNPNFVGYKQINNELPTDKGYGLIPSAYQEFEWN